MRATFALHAIVKFRSLSVVSGRFSPVSYFESRVITRIQEQVHIAVEILDVVSLSLSVSS